MKHFECLGLRRLSSKNYEQDNAYQDQQHKHEREN